VLSALSLKVAFIYSNSTSRSDLLEKLSFRLLIFLLLFLKIFIPASILGLRSFNFGLFLLKDMDLLSKANYTRYNTHGL